MATILFNIKAEVFDGKDITYLRLRDEDVEALLQVSCEQILFSMMEPDYKYFPEVLSNLLDKHLLFLVEVKKNGGSFEEGCFKARRVCAQPELIRMFRKGEMFGQQSGQRSTIEELLREGQGICCRDTEGSTTGSARVIDNFSFVTSIVGRPYSSSSVSFRYLGLDATDDMANEEPMDKHCGD
ncbi:hypothetical protein SESBI_39786 [Sesbania bispinosa]|nr:hypothetical protein SESBI_39786 [Sesbania bispinosa]